MIKSTYILSVLSILSVNSFAQNIDKTNAVLYERVTTRPEITNIYSNPYNSEEIKVELGHWGPEILRARHRPST